MTCPAGRRGGIENKICPLGEQSLSWASLLPLCLSLLSARLLPELTVEVLGFAVLREARSLPYLQYTHLLENSTLDILNKHFLNSVLYLFGFLAIFQILPCFLILNPGSLLKTVITNNSTSFLNYMCHSGSLQGVSVI